MYLKQKRYKWYKETYDFMVCSEGRTLYIKRIYWVYCFYRSNSMFLHWIMNLVKIKENEDDSIIKL